MVIDFEALVWADYKYAEEIEQGRLPKDLKRMLNTSLKVRTSRKKKSIPDYSVSAQYAGRKCYRSDNARRYLLSGQSAAALFCDWTNTKDIRHWCIRY